jgi:hypothetical protein
MKARLLAYLPCYRFFHVWGRKGAHHQGQSVLKMRIVGSVFRRRFVAAWQQNTTKSVPGVASLQLVTAKTDRPWARHILKREKGPKDNKRHAKPTAPYYRGGSLFLHPFESGLCGFPLLPKKCQRPAFPRAFDACCSFLSLPVYHQKVRGAGGSRTHDGGFAIRCLSHLATAPSNACTTIDR